MEDCFKLQFQIKFNAIMQQDGSMSVAGKVVSLQTYPPVSTATFSRTGTEEQVKS